MLTGETVEVSRRHVVVAALLRSGKDRAAAYRLSSYFSDNAVIIIVIAD
jgi:hypothetical protein